MKTEEKKKRNIIPIILLIVIIGGSIFGIREFLYFSKHEDTDDAQIDADISPVVARVGGYVDTILFEENQHVNQDQVLVKLDDQDYQIKLEQSMAGQRGASAGIGVSRAQINATSASSATAKSNIAAARVKLWQASKDFERYSNLIKDGAITQQQFDQARAQKETAQANYQAAVDQYQAALEQVGTTRSQLQVSNTGADY
jgi:membrane fusion protein (multidrug efflux system)